MAKTDCKIIHNYLKSKDEVRLPGAIREANTTGEIVKILIEAFPKFTFGDFSLSKETSSDPDGLTLSIIDFIGTLEEKLSSEKHKSLDLSKDGDAMKYIKDSLELYYLAEDNPEGEEEDLGVMANMEKNEEQRIREKLNSALNKFFKNNVAAREFFKKQVKTEIAVNAIVDLNSDDGIVESEERLNSNLEKLLNNKYTKIVAYLKSVGTKETFDLKGFPTQLINNNHEINEDSLKVIYAFYDLLNLKNQQDILQSEVEYGWRTISNGGENAFLDALHAYLVVTYLDDLSADSIGRYIGKNKQKYPIEVNEKGAITYKYHFGVDRSNRVNSWGVDARDVLKEMGNFTKFLIEMIPLVNPETGESTGDYVTPVQFMNAFTQVFSQVQNIKVPIVRNAIIHFSDNPVEQLRVILEKVHEAVLQHYKSTQDSNSPKSILYGELVGGATSNGVINVFDLKVLDSVYRTLYLGRRSLYNIEQRYNESHGLSSRYPLVETLASEIQSSTAMYYLITRWDRSLGTYVTEVKERFAEGNKYHNMRISINKSNQTNTYDENLYKIISKTSLEDMDIYRIKIKDSILRIAVNTDIDHAPYGIFTKKERYNTLSDQTIDIKIKSKGDNKWIDFKELDANIDLTNHSLRSDILRNRTGLNRTFLDILDFIQLFTLLKFGVDNDSLLTYDIYRNQQYGLTHDLVFAAVRGLVIADINEKFRQFRIDNPGIYTASLLYKFILDKKLAPQSITQFKEGSTDWTTVWEATSRGNNLLSILSKEKWLKYYINAQEIMTGEVSKANIKNGAGDSQPNYGLTFEGANPLKVLNDSQHKVTLKVLDELGNPVLDEDGKEQTYETYRALEGNLFTRYLDLILNTSTDMEVTLMDGTNKPVKLMTDSELYYHAIYDKFILPMASNRTMWIQPTTYSDKVKYVLHQVKTRFEDVDLLTAPISKIQELYINSIGQQYRYQLKDIINDYAKIYGFPEVTFDPTYELSAKEAIEIRKVVRDIESRLRNETEKSLNAKVNEYNKLHPTERLEFMLDSHFRIIKKTLMFNESLIHLALDVYTLANLPKRLKKEMFYFMQDLMKGRFGLHYLPIVVKEEKGTGKKISEVSLSHPVGKLLHLLGVNNNLWFNSKNSLILARVPGTTNDEGQITNINDLKEDSIINPLLERFFLIHSLLGNNLRMIHTGSEMNHRNKELEKYDWNKKIGELKNIENANKLSVIKKFNPSLYNAIVQAASVYGVKNISMIEKFWNTLSAENVRTIISFLPPDEIKEYDDLLEEMLYETEATSQGAQLKRNVSIPATMRPYTPSMKGIGRVMNLAIMKDIRAQIFNINGDVDEEDAHDGAALINGVTSIHENWSLSENEVGTIKKPIWHSYNGKHGTAGLVKFAAHAMTNNLIRNSQSAVDLLKLSKKMNDSNWEQIPELIQFLQQQGEYNPNAINLLQVAYHNASGETTFSLLVNGNTEVYYEGTKGEYWAITDIGYEISEDGYGTYTTTEHLALDTGAYDKGVTVYHYFTEKGEHVKKDRILTGLELLKLKLHATRSIYEFQQMFGGIYSMEKVGKKLQYSETSNYIAANFINNVTIPTALRLEEQEEYNEALRKYNEKYRIYLEKKEAGEKVDPPKKPRLVDKLDLEHYILPLKSNKIDYICNNSAIKNGAGNRNESERFYNEEALDYITMSTEYYGIQMDADHDADEAELTEFSQVISALDAGGRLHPYVTSIYKALGMIAIQESKTEFNAISYYQKIANISDDDPDKEEKLKIARDKLYTVIGNTVLANISIGSSRSGLTDAIVKNIKRTFNLNGSHLSDEELKLPFSDSNLYSLVLSTFASLITKKSIRKQYPGVGAVISPAYDMLMVYDVDGETYKFDDIAKQAIIQYKKWQLSADKKEDPYNNYFKDIKETSDTSLWKKDLVKAYLLKKEDDLNRNAEYAKPLLEEPEDWSDLLQYFDPLNKVKVYYYDGTGKAGEKTVDLSDIRVYYEFMANPSNYLKRELKNASIKISSFKKVITEGRNLAPSMAVWLYQDGEVTKRKNIYSSAILINLFLKEADKTVKVKGVNSAYQDCYAFYEREKAKDGGYKDIQSLLDDLANNTWNGKSIELKTSEAELIMSNIYLTKFGIDHYVSLADVLKNPKEYFKEKPKPQLYGSADSSFYDLVMMKGNGQHQYISIDSSFTVDDKEDKYYTTYWRDRNLHREIFVDRRSPEEIKASPNKVVNEVYVMDENNRPLFKVGRDIERTDLSYNSDGKFFYNHNTLEKVESKNLTYINGRVIEYVEFVSQHVYRKGSNKFKVFNINTENLKRATNPGNEDILYSLIQEIVKSLYQADSYEVLTLNDNRVKVKNVYTLKRILPGLVNDFSYDAKLSAYIDNLNNFINKNLPHIKEDEKGLSFVLKEGSITKQREGEEVTVSQNRLGYKLDETTGDLLIPSKTGGKAILQSQINEYYKDLAKKKLASFKLARYFTASRIPAQTLLSFMAMKLVAFTGEPGAQAYVSHWQTWLQGSDYDIDKAYIMGLAFDDNSSYVGWSTLFDYFSDFTLKASQELPMSDPNIEFTFSNDEDAIDVTNEVENIGEVNTRTKIHRDDTTAKEYKPYTSDFEESKERVKRVKAYVKILLLLDLGKKIKSTSRYNNDVIEALKKHRDTILPPNAYSQALRNFISSHIQGTVQHIRNMKDSYIPVAMGDLQDAAKNSPKGQESKRITLVNPLSIYKMQRQNMIGKNVIAIAATGLKAAFMWNYYLNDVYSSAKEGIDYTFLTNEEGKIVLDDQGNPILLVTPNSDLQFALFSFISKLLGPLNNKGIDSEGKEYMYTEIRTLPNVNFERAMDSMKDYAKRHKLNPKKPVDIMISEMISAATDNAKELILAKINAGDTLAKCHLFLITLGFDIDLIVLFMTGDVMDWVDRISGLNIFLNQNRSVSSAAELILDYLLYQLAILNGENAPKELRKGDLDLVQQIVPNNLTKEQITKYLLDILEFRNILAGANEFSDLGNLLSVNLGIPGKAEDLQARLDKLYSILVSRDSKVNLTEYEKFKYIDIANGNFDPVKWLQDQKIKVTIPVLDALGNITMGKDNLPMYEEKMFSYRQLTSEYYDKLKTTINIFAIANHLPHFRNMFALMGSEYTVYNFAVKSKLLLKIVKDTRELIPDMFIDSRFYSKALLGANDLLIIKYFKERDFKFPVKVKTEIIKDATGNTGRASRGAMLDLSTNVGRANFKYYFETYVIPRLQAGTFEELSDEENKEVSKNEFIRSLIPSVDDHRDIWKLDLDMSSESTYTTTLLTMYGKALMLLNYIKINEHSLADWFAIYNLIINKNRYGSDRLTKAFDYFINNYDSTFSSVINDFLRFVGDLDKEDTNIDEAFQFDVIDIFMLQAKLVTDTGGLTDPVVIKLDDNNNFVYYIKKSKDKYSPFKKLVIKTIIGETPDNRLERFTRIRNYFILNNTHSDYVEATIKDLKNNPADTLRRLMLDGTLKVLIHCE